jgi:TolB-like protein
MPNIDKILKQLKNRKVFRSIAIYAGFAFVLLQVCDIVIPRLFLPEWTMTFIIVLTIIGFPIIAVLSWIYDITPSDGKEPSTETTQPIGIYALTGLVLTVIGVGFWVIVGVFGVSFGGDEERLSIAVLIPENISNIEHAILNRKIAEDLIIDISRFSSGAIILPSINEVLSTKNSLKPKKISRLLNTKYVLISSLFIEENNFELRCRLIEPYSRKSLYSKTWSDKKQNLPIILEILSMGIIKSLDIEIVLPTKAIPSPLIL